MLKKAKVIFILGIVLLTTTMCNPLDQRISKMHVGYFPNVTHVQALVGRATGAFQKAVGENVEVIFHDFNAGPSEIISYFSNELDIGYIGPVPAINGCIKSNGDLVIIAGATHAGAILVVSESSNIESIADLSHKKIAVPQLGNTQHLSLLTLLKSNNLMDATKGGTVDIVSAENATIYQLFQSMQIDAAFVPEPWASRLIMDANAKILLDFDEVFLDGDYCSTVVVARKTFIEEHPELVRAFLMAHYNITMDIRKDPVTARALVSNQIERLTGQKHSDALLTTSFSKFSVSYDPTIDAVMKIMEMSYSEGFIDKTIAAEELFDLGILNSILLEMQNTTIDF